MTLTIEDCERALAALINQELKANHKIIDFNSIIARPGCAQCENLLNHIPEAKNRFEQTCSLCRNLADICAEANVKIAAQSEDFKNYKNRVDTEKKQAKYLLVLGDAIQGLMDNVYNNCSKKYKSKGAFFDLLKIDDNTAVQDLYAVLRNFNMSKNNFDELVKVKDRRNIQCHSTMATKHRLEFLTNNPEPMFATAWNILKAHKNMLYSSNYSF